MGFLFYLNMQSAKTTSEEGVRESIDSIIQNTPIKVYIESCLEKSTEDGLFLLGKQGGRIYDIQVPGTTRYFGNINTLEYKEGGDVYYVSYGIYNKDEDPPEYPYLGSLVPDNKEGTLGLAALLPLCDNDGLNSWSIPDARYSCIQYDAMESEHSIQEYLEKYIVQEMSNCVDLATLSTDLGYEFMEGDISARVLFGEADVLTTIEYELIVKGEDNETMSKIIQSSANPDIRFKKLYELAYYMIREDTSNIFFDFEERENLEELYECPHPNRESFNEPCLKEEMSVVQLREVCPSCSTGEFSDVVQIIDDVSYTRGQPFVFQFAVKNRAPAIDYLNKDIGNDIPYYLYLEETYTETPSLLYSKAGSCTQCDIVLKEGQTLKILPHAIDPDGDYVLYEYTGWKGQELMSSSLFQDTKKDALIPTIAGDAGSYITRIKAFDHQGLFDYQDVRIRVNSQGCC